MSTQTNFVADSIDRVQEAFQSVGDELERLQGQFDNRRKKFETNTQQRVKQLQKDLSQQPLFKRADGIRRDATKQIEQRVEGVLSTFNIATSADMKRIDRKLNAISKRLKGIEQRSKAKAASPESL